MINYDWKDTGSAEYFEREFYGFRFRGEGWYDNGVDAVYLKKKRDADSTGPAIYDFYCWNNRSVENVRHDIKKIANAVIIVQSQPTLEKTETS